MILWRISNHADLRGIGGLKAAGRWHNRGHPVVYLAESQPGALLEVLVHIEVTRLEDLPTHYTLLKVVGATSVTDCPAMPDDWVDTPAVTRRVGDEWLSKGGTALLRVPSAIIPGVWNLLLNPLHPEASGFRIEEAMRVPFDRRLFGTLGQSADTT